MMSEKPKFGFIVEYVEDIEAARRFYVEVLGLEVERVDQAILPKENVMANRIFSAAMSFYCSLMLSSSFMTASQGIKLAAMGGAPAPAATSPAAPAVETLTPPQDAPAAKKEEPLKDLAEKIRKEGKSGFIAKDLAVAMGIDAKENVPAKGYINREDGGGGHIVLVSEKLDIIIMAVDKEDNKIIVLTDPSGAIRKSVRYDAEKKTRTEIPAKDAKKSFDAEVAYWKLK